MNDLPPKQIYFVKVLLDVALHVPCTGKKSRCVCHQCVLCSVLMGAGCSLGSAKVNYCTGRRFWLHRIIA